MGSKFLTVMLSSRCNDEIEYKGSKVKLSEVRKEAKKAIENIKIGGERLFQCWINEDAPPAGGDNDSWEMCLNKAAECDVMIVLYNGNAGWTKGEEGDQGRIGICHAELDRAFTSNPKKVHLIKLPDFEKKLRDEHAKMERYVKKIGLFESRASTGEDVLVRLLEALGEITRKLAKAGVGDAVSSAYHLGEALDWSRLDFENRKNEIERVLLSSLDKRTGGSKDGEIAFAKLCGKEVLFRCHGIPAAFSISAARELVGQPFLRDYEWAGKLNAKKIGPVHLVGCHKGVSESQAITMLGFPDAIIVDPKFGIYVADPIQKVQLLLLRNCRDDTSTRHAVQRAFDWLERSGEDSELVRRATARKNICKAISKEATR